MRVFVTGTGRCGTCTFWNACRTLTNYTAGHESEAGRVPSYRFADQHIEISSQLVIAIPHLLARYEDTKWVHLIREREDCVRSLAHQCSEAMAAFSLQWFQATSPYEVAWGSGAFYDRVNELCAALLTPLGPERYAQIRLEEAADAWPEFVAWIGGEGDVAAGAREFTKAYNSGRQRGRDKWVPGPGYVEAVAEPAVEPEEEG